MTSVCRHFFLARLVSIILSLTPVRLDGWTETIKGIDQLATSNKKDSIAFRIDQITNELFLCHQLRTDWQMCLDCLVDFDHSERVSLENSSFRSVSFLEGNQKVPVRYYCVPVSDQRQF
jgi:hypothetical protein